MNTKTSVLENDTTGFFLKPAIPPIEQTGDNRLGAEKVVQQLKAMASTSDEISKFEHDQTVSFTKQEIITLAQSGDNTVAKSAQRRKMHPVFLVVLALSLVNNLYFFTPGLFATSLFSKNVNYFSSMVKDASLAIFPLAVGDKKIVTKEMRPVRSMVVTTHKDGDSIILTGQLHARDEITLAFRISGKLTERLVTVGDTVKAGQVIGYLDAETEKNARDAAEADYAAAQAVLEQSVTAEKRLGYLLEEKAVSRAEYEGVLRQLKTARAQVNVARAKLRSAKDQLGYTELKAEVSGVITAKGAEPGEVIQAGQMIVTLARQNGRDAVFDMPALIVRNEVAKKQKIEVWLADNADIKTTGYIREISPQADPAMLTYQVKVDLINPPPSMFLGSTVVGKLKVQVQSLLKVPASALAMVGENPAVWVIDPSTMSVHRREIKIARYTQNGAVISSGLQSGEKIATAGTQSLYDGQTVKLLEVTYEGR